VPTISVLFGVTVIDHIIGFGPKPLFLSSQLYPLSVLRIMPSDVTANKWPLSFIIIPDAAGTILGPLSCCHEICAYFILGRKINIIIKNIRIMFYPMKKNVLTNISASGEYRLLTVILGK
jgi:hypothetical protein